MIKFRLWHNQKKGFLVKITSYKFSMYNIDQLLNSFWILFVLFKNNSSYKHFLLQTLYVLKRRCYLQEGKYKNYYMKYNINWRQITNTLTFFLYIHKIYILSFNMCLFQVHLTKYKFIDKPSRLTSYTFISHSTKVKIVSLSIVNNDYCVLK